MISRFYFFGISSHQPPALKFDAAVFKYMVDVQDQNLHAYLYTRPLTPLK